MGKQAANDVQTRIDRFLSRKALEYPKIGLVVTHPAVIESTLRPLHETLADNMTRVSLVRIAKFLDIITRYTPAHTPKTSF